MNDLWNSFSEFYGGQFLAREKFEQFCQHLLEVHYPDKKVFIHQDLASIDTKKLAIFYLPKFILDGLNTSRKGQIRNAFNEFVESKKNSAVKVYAWVVCLPYVLDDIEMKWWLDWKNKNTIKSGINIQIFDGNHLIELAKKYGIYNQYFNFELIKNSHQESKDSQEISEILDVQTNEDNNLPQNSHQLEEHHDTVDENIEHTLNTEEKIESTDNTEKHDFTEQQEDGTEQQPIVKQQQVSTEQQNLEETTNNTHQIITNQQKIILNTLISQFKHVSSLYNSLNVEEKAKFANLNKKNWDKLYETFDEETLPTDALNVFQKAKHYQEIRKSYLTALYLYHRLPTCQNFDKLYKKYKDIEDSIILLQNKSFAILYEVEGDIYNVQDKYNEAKSCYEKAYFYDPKSTDLKFKYNLFAGITNVFTDAKIAKQRLKTAKSFNIEDKRLKSYLLLSRLLVLSQVPILKYFTSFFAYSVANSIAPSDYVVHKQKTATKNFYYAISVVIILIAILFATYNIPKSQKQIVQKPKTKVLKPLTIFDIAIAEGDSIMKKVSLKYIHLIDTVIYSYRRAFEATYYINPKANDIAAERLKIAQDYKSNYINKAQINILKDSAYYIPMRRYSEGLQLVKYLFEPYKIQNGKYGYIDSNKVFVIPPIYDFDPERLYTGIENFQNGRAVVCLFLTNGDTAFLSINKHNQVRYKIITKSKKTNPKNK